VNIPFGERYAAAILEGGGILVDLTTGDFTRLNASAAIVYEVMSSSQDFPAAVEEIARRLGITCERATQAIEATVTGLAHRAPRQDPAGAFHYRLANDGAGYDLFFAGAPRIRVSTDGQFVRALPGPALREAELYEYVRSVGPKILFLRGGAVIHGAACTLKGRSLAISGESGAGKTTTVRAFVEAGARPISEDILVVASPSPTSIYVEGEKAMHGWAKTMARQLAAAPDRDLPTAEIDQALRGGTTCLSEIWMVSAARRVASDRIALKPLGAIDATLAVMKGLFLGDAAAPGWRRFLTLSSSIAAATPILDSPMPNGIGRLAAAAKAYIENSAS
jgi:hypothetical protein